MKVRFLGHATLEIEINGKIIIVDPFITGNPKAKHISLSDLKADYILITHAHQDHVLDVPALAKQAKALLISNAEIISYYQQDNIEGHMMNTGGKWKFDFGTIRATIAHHSSSFADGNNGGCPNGYIIEAENKRIYIAGDTSLTYDMKLIPETIGKLDLAVFPIGDNFTMGYEDACIASDFVQCNRILGYHYDTFPPIEIDQEKATKLFESKGKELILLPIGDSISV